MPAKIWPPCAAPGCNRAGRYAQGFCQAHYQAWKNYSVHNGSPARGAENIMIPTRPSWEYTNNSGEADLAAKTAKQEKKS